MRHLLLAIAAFVLAPLALAQTTWYVDDDATGLANGTSWTDAFPFLQDALSAALPTDTIWVAEGRYAPDRGVGFTSGDQKASFTITSGLSLYGGFAGTEAAFALRAGLFDTTILDGDLAGDDATGGLADNSNNVVVGTGTSAATVFDGFTVRGGRAVGSPGSGGGFFATNAALRIENCVFRDNYADDDGGAMSATSGAGPTLVHCTFLDNEASDVGGGIWFSSNSPGPIVIGSRFLGNVSGRLGGGVYHFSPATTQTGFYDCLFSGNTAADRGGGIWFSSNLGVPVVGCTFSRNEAASAGGGVGASKPPSISSSVFWENTAAGQSDLKGQLELISGPYVDHSCVQGYASSLTGIGNTGSDPLLLDPLGPDGILGTVDDAPWPTVGSPTIDAGDGTAFLADVVDLDGDGDVIEPLPLDLLGKPRFQDELIVPDSGLAAPGLGVPDMGAAERYDPQPLEGTPAAVSIQHGGTQSLYLEAPSELAGRTYLLLGSEFGEQPGFLIAGLVLPLNLGPYLFHTLASPNQPPLTGSLGTLDAAGDAQAAFTLPPLVLSPAFAGASLHHAYLVFDVIGGAATVVFASNAWPVQLGP